MNGIDSEKTRPVPCQSFRSIREINVVSQSKIPLRPKAIECTGDSPKSVISRNLIDQRCATRRCDYRCLLPAMRCVNFQYMQTMRQRWESDGVGSNLIAAKRFTAFQLHLPFDKTVDCNVVRCATWNNDLVRT